MKTDRSLEPSRRAAYSKIGEQGQHEKISNGDPGGGGDPDGTGGVLVSLGDGLPSLEGERERLMHLLSSIIG
jgi:hypothetical protein